jgi:hypothetical protein
MEYKYSTPAKLIIIHGRAIAVDLSANFPDAKVSGKQPAHMTILFDKGGFSKGVFERAEKCIEKWKTEKKVDSIGFNLEPYGKKSDAIKGPLEVVGQINGSHTLNYVFDNNKIRLIHFFTQHEPSTSHRTQTQNQGPSWVHFACEWCQDQDW